MEQDYWTPISSPPEKTGWEYYCKDDIGEFPAFYVSTASGNTTWLAPGNRKPLFWIDKRKLSQMWTDKYKEKYGNKT